MTALPRPIAKALDAHTRRPIAYLQIDSGLLLVGAGGNLESFGLSGMRAQQPAAPQAIFLEGLLPPPETPFVLPAIEVGGGRAADLHFYRDGNHVWVVLLDVTAERDQARRIQQKAYDMHSCRNAKRCSIGSLKRPMRPCARRSANSKVRAPLCRKRMTNCSTS